MLAASYSGYGASLKRIPSHIEKRREAVKLKIFILLLKYLGDFHNIKRIYSHCKLLQKDLQLTG